MVHGWPQETIIGSGRTVLLVEEGVNLVGHLREKGQVLPSKTLGTFPLLSVLVEGGELDLARSVITVVEDGGFDASNANLKQAKRRVKTSFGSRENSSDSVSQVAKKSC